jgi:hypothetical protein
MNVLRANDHIYQTYFIAMGDDTNYDEIERDIRNQTPHGSNSRNSLGCEYDDRAEHEYDNMGYPIDLSKRREGGSRGGSHSGRGGGGSHGGRGGDSHGGRGGGSHGGRGGSIKAVTQHLVGQNGHGRQLIFPSTGKSTLYKGKRWFPRLYGSQWWLGRHEWFAPYYERYAPLWYPAYWTPLYVYDERNAYVRNPELATLSVIPSMALPCFQADLGLLRYDRQSLSIDEEVRVESTLDDINQQLDLFKAEMQTNPGYFYWTKRGFVVVPDLDRGCFVWAYARPQQEMTISSSFDLNAGKGQTHMHQHHRHEHTGVDVTTLTNEEILFDVYSETTPYAGHFISQDGDVYAYTIDSHGKGKTTFVDRLVIKVPPNEIERLKDMLRDAWHAKVDHFRHDSGDRKYWGFLANERMFIRGDDNSHSAESDALVNEIDRILFKNESTRKSLYPAY